MPDALELLMGTVGRGWKRGGLEVREEESKEERECVLRALLRREKIDKGPAASPHTADDGCCNHLSIVVVVVVLYTVAYIYHDAAD